jgi:hypothetical protein
MPVTTTKSVLFWDVTPCSLADLLPDYMASHSRRFYSKYFCSTTAGRLVSLVCLPTSYFGEVGLPGSNFTVTRRSWLGPFVGYPRSFQADVEMVPLNGASSFCFTYFAIHHSISEFSSFWFLQKWVWSTSEAYLKWLSLCHLAGSGVDLLFDL